MSPTSLILLFGTIGIILLIVFILKVNTRRDNVQDQLERLRATIESKLERSQSELHQVLHRQDAEAKKLIIDITQKLTEVKEGNKQVFSMTEQLQNLEKILTHQKQRGSWGEASLELILSGILPPGVYETQYRFRNGETVDAIIHTKEGLIPVDAKFSLDNYSRLINEENPERRAELENAFKKDLKARIDETSKYIREEEGTLPFAFMFIPAEGIYYDLLVNEIGAVKVNTRSLIDYAYKDKKVIIVSPTTFFAYLQSVLYGFKAFKIEESAKHIQARVEELGRHLLAYELYMRKLGGTLRTSVGHYNTAYNELKKIDKDVVRITGGVASIEPQLLDKPTFDDEV